MNLMIEILMIVVLSVSWDLNCGIVVGNQNFYLVKELFFRKTWIVGLHLSLDK
jgi:hypothetical protein